MSLISKLLTPKEAPLAFNIRRSRSIVDQNHVADVGNGLLERQPQLLPDVCVGKQKFSSNSCHQEHNGLQQEAIQSCRSSPLFAPLDGTLNVAGKNDNLAQLGITVYHTDGDSILRLVRPTI